MSDIPSQKVETTPKIEKVFIDPITQRLDAFKLARNVIKSGFKPDFMVALWRGGCFIGMCMHELFKYVGWDVDHIAIRTSKYTGINEASSTVQVHNLTYLKERIKPGQSILLVDDVWDTGSR